MKMDINSILKYTRPKETYYDLLGCHQSSNVEQISREYKIKALQLHPDKNPDPTSADKFKQLQRAKEVLTDSSLRKSYDVWLNSGLQIPFEQWQTKKGHSMHWAPRGTTRLGIQEREPCRSDNIATNRGGGASLLNKFRNYEI